MSKLDALKGHLPKYERAGVVVDSALSPVASELGALDSRIEDALLQFFVSTATATGLDRWEAFLGLSSYAGKPLDQRRSRIISKIRGAGTSTAALIKNIAESYSNGEVDVLEYNGEYKFIVEFISTIGIPPNEDDLKAAIEEAKPAHLAAEYLYRYITHGMLADKTHGFLADYTHEEIRTTQL